MTMAKKLPVLDPSIHTFEIHGTYHRLPIMVNLFERMKELVKERKYYPANKKKPKKQNKSYCYTRNGGGLRVELGQRTEHGDWHIILSGINLARIAGNTSRLALVELSPAGFNYQIECFFMELEQLGFLEYEHEIDWILWRIDVTQDFYVKCDPALPIKLVRYSGEAMPYGKGQENHYDLHNEKRSARFEKEEYNFEIYDKHQALLSDVRKGFYVPEKDVEQSKNLVRFEIQLKRKYLLKVEKRFLGFDANEIPIKPRLREIPFLLVQIWKIASGILYNRTEELFGNDPWYYANIALEKTKESYLSDSTKELLVLYIKSVNEERQVPTYSRYQKSKIKKALKSLGINSVIIPDRILNAREYARLPYAPLCSKVQGIRENL